MQPTVSIRQICWLLEDAAGVGAALGDLALPCRIAWPSDPQELLNARDAVRQTMAGRQDPASLDFLDLSAFTSVLLRGDPLSIGTPAWWRDHFGSGRFLSDIAWDRWLSARWVAAPVPVAYPDHADSPLIGEHIFSGNRCARLVTFMVGHGDLDTHHMPHPLWVSQILSSDSLSALADAFAAARGVSPTTGEWLSFPLCPPGSGPVSGRSLGLPLALAGLSAATGHPLCRHLVATGDIAPDGEVLMVGEGEHSLSSKAACAAKAGYRLFLFPSANLPAPIFPDHLETKAVSDLGTAWIWARLFSGERCDEIRRLEIASRSAEDFINNCGSLPVSLLKWCLRESSRNLGRKFPELCADRRNRTEINKLVEELERSLIGENADLDRAQVLSGLVHEGLLNQEAFTPLSAYSWCSLNLTVANHLGEIAVAEKWTQLARRFEEPAKRADERQFARFVNRQFISERHSRYAFHPALPSQFQELLDRERASCVAPGAVNFILGGLCGTAAQNYAFCGPQYLEQTWLLVEEAQTAFGGGKVEESRGDWRRQLNYLCYALLDAGHIAEAGKVLLDYLERDGASISETHRDEDYGMAAAADHVSALLRACVLQDLSRDSLFQIAAAARFLWECCASGLLENGTLDSKNAASQLLAHLPADHGDYPLKHPLQLFTFNMGRMACHLGDHHLARSLWDISARLCRGLGETGGVMALLPLSLLDEELAGDLPENLRNQAQGVLDLICQSKYLNREHFDALLNSGEVCAALAAVRDNLAKLFPFTYR